MEITGLNAEETYKVEKQLQQEAIKDLQNEIITWQASLIYADKEIKEQERKKRQFYIYIKECEEKIDILSKCEEPE